MQTRRNRRSLLHAGAAVLGGGIVAGRLTRFAGTAAAEAPSDLPAGPRLKIASVKTYPHCWGGDVAIAASAHLLARLPEPHWGLPSDTPMLEIDQSEIPWRDGLAIEPLAARDGFIRVPRKPGLGIEVDEAVVRKYAVS